MTVINNGKRVTLTIPDLFAGMCGISRGVVAFTPPVPVSQPKAAYSATLDGGPVVLTNLQPAGDGRSYTAQVLG